MRETFSVEKIALWWPPLLFQPTFLHVTSCRPFWWSQRRKANQSANVFTFVVSRLRPKLSDRKFTTLARQDLQEHFTQRHFYLSPQWGCTLVLPGLSRCCCGYCSIQGDDVSMSPCDTVFTGCCASRCLEIALSSGQPHLPLLLVITAYLYFLSSPPASTWKHHLLVFLVNTTYVYCWKSHLHYL